MSKKEVSVIVVDYNTLNDPDFTPPSQFYFRDALGDYIFIKTTKRSIAEQYVKDKYDGQYSVRVM